MIPEYRLWPRWQTATSAPKDGSAFLGREVCSNQAMAVRWNEKTNAFHRIIENYEQINICQWITFQQFSDIQRCVWNGDDNCS